MKFEDYLMERKCQHPQKRQDLEKEVVILHAHLKGEQALNRVLHCALHGPIFSLPLIPSLFPPQVHELLEELAMVEEEIILLERKVKELNLRLYQERDQCREWEMHHRRKPKQCNNNQLQESSGYGPMITEHRSSSHNYEVLTKERKIRDRRTSLGSSWDIHSLLSMPRRSNEYEVPRRNSTRKIPTQYPLHIQTAIEKPNELSEELLKCLIGIFLELNHAPLDREESETVPIRLTLSCMKSTGFMAKTSFSCKTPSFLSNGSASSLDPYGTSSDLDCKYVSQWLLSPLQYPHNSHSRGHAFQKDAVNQRRDLPETLTNKILVISEIFSKPVDPNDVKNRLDSNADVARRFLTSSARWVLETEPNKLSSESKNSMLRVLGIGW